MQFVYIKDDALSKKECERIIKVFESNPLKHKEGITLSGTEHQSKKSTDWCKSFAHEDCIDLLLEEKLVEHTRNYHDFVKGINFVSSSWSLDPYYNIQRYEPKEGYFAWHHEHGMWDRFPKNPAIRRILAWMIYLNDVPDGGTEFMDQEQTIEAKSGRIVIWPAYWTHTHRGQISNTTIKYIATGWYNFDIPQ